MLSHTGASLGPGGGAAVVGLVLVAALLLLVAGVTKLAHPASAEAALLAARLPLTGRGTSWWARGTGLAEGLVAGSVLVVGGRVPALLLTVTYVVLGVFSLRMSRVAPGADCGCFGSTSNPVTGWHVLVNAVFAVVGGLAIARPPPSAPVVLTEHTWSAIPLVGLVAVLTYLCYLVMTALPPLLRGVTGPVDR